MQNVPTSRDTQQAAVSAAYRRLAIAILALDVATLARQLASASSPALEQQAA
jgi:hypothetical protein